MVLKELHPLQLQSDLSELIEAQIEQNGLNILPVKLDHIYALKHLSYYHKDPFDRLLIAQAKLESMVLVTADEKIRQYAIETIG